ncbi:MAG: mannose-6-phosphate isomerase, class I, partial [Actinomycetota bacterium]|nr:mannose-6-phosphate isomerase, class I [Actinomycetota bacterium]
MYRLGNPVQHYAWGSHTALAELRGEPSPTAQPEAELWLGAHPTAPSTVAVGGAERSLTDVIAADPEALLGPGVLAEFGPRLPFLLKVLAVDQPLSLQAHPDLRRAREGYAAEQDRGLDPADPGRNYRDPNHKPELLYALTPFDALCGLRPRAEIEALLGELGIAELRITPEGGLPGLVGDILRAPDPAR